MQVYSFRVEVGEDFDLFLKNAQEQGHVVEVDLRLTDRRMPEQHVQIQVDLPLEGLRDLMRLQEDSHLMVQTVRPLPMSKNDLSRDWSVA